MLIHDFSARLANGEERRFADYRHDPAEIDVAVDALAREPGIGLADLPDVFMVQNRDRLIALAVKYRLPAIYTGSFWTKSGGLMSYGPDTTPGAEKRGT
jgi:hypothetical protein